MPARNASNPNRVRFVLWVSLAFIFATSARAQTNFAVIVRDGAWTWFNDPRAVFHDGILFVGYVKNTDGRSGLGAFNPATGSTTELWTSGATQKDDHNNPGLLVKQDGSMLAIHARHNTDQYFYYRLSSTNPAAPGNWSAEMTIPSTGVGVTYANPFQLSAESGQIYNFMRDLNFNPTVVISTNGGTNWSNAQLFIKTGTGSIRPYVKYCSDAAERIDFLYTDGHPRDLTNSLYHLYYRSGNFFQTDGTFVKSFANLPILHDANERGSVVYQFSNVETEDPNDHIPTGRAWCWQIGYQTNGNPVCVFSVQRDQVTGPNWFDARIYYYYARWTGTNWQKRFIAQGGRPLYTPEIDYAGGVCLDPEDPNVVYFSSNAQNPLNLANTTNVALNTNARYELFRGTTTNGGLNFNWQAVTANSAQDNLRPYIPPHHGQPMVIWFRGTYTSFSAYNCEIVGLFSDSIPQPPRVQIVSPVVDKFALPNLHNKLKVAAILEDDGLPRAATVLWTTSSGPTNAVFENETNLQTSVGFPVAGTYILRVTADDGTAPQFAEMTVFSSPFLTTNEQVLHLKLDELSGTNAVDSSGLANHGTLLGGTIWRSQSGIHDGALEFDGASGQVVVTDADNLDNTSAFSLCFWFNASAYPGDSGGLVCKRNNISDNNAFTTWLKSSDRRIYVDVIGSNNRFSSAALIETNEWYHVSLIFDGSLPTAQRVKLWINGQLDSIATETNAAIPNYTSSVRIGNTHPGATNWFKGLIDDIRFYRRALPTNEIMLLANRTEAANISIPPAMVATNRLSTPINATVVPNSTAMLWTQTTGSGMATLAPSNTAITTVTFNERGNYVLKLGTLNNPVEVFDELPVLVQPNTNVFTDWSSFYFSPITNQDVIGSNSDPDGDGIINFTEFAFGMNPTQPDAFPFSGQSMGLPVAQIENVSGTNYLTLRLKRPLGRFDIGYESKVSSNLTNWSSLSPFTIISNSNATETVIFRDGVPASSTPSRFLHLQLRKP